jgi:para-nitrobenzyl esterase
MTEKDRVLSNKMADYLCSFVRTGDPNGEGRPVWKPFGNGQTAALRLGEGSTRMGKPSTLKLVYTMLTNKAVGE